jgi:predicted RNase H-like HicB family nuclease
MMYRVVFEQAADGGIGAYVPDMPGVAVVGDNEGEALQLLDEAVKWHVRGMIEDGDPIPEPSELPQGPEMMIVLDNTFVQHNSPAVSPYLLAASNAAPLWKSQVQPQRVPQPA